MAIQHLAVILALVLSELFFPSQTADNSIELGHALIFHCIIILIESNLAYSKLSLKKVCMHAPVALLWWILSEVTPYIT